MARKRIKPQRGEENQGRSELEFGGDGKIARDRGSSRIENGASRSENGTDPTEPNLSLDGLFTERGLLAQMIETCVGRAIEAEFDRYIGAGRYERTARRKSRRNGTKPRTMKTAVGALEFDVPQSRDGGFRPQAFERYQRSDKALVGAMAEMVIQGVSTRRVSAVLESMAGVTPSAQTVSRAMAELDEQIASWRSRSLDKREYPFLLIDARYEKVRVRGRVVSQAVMIATGINDEGHRELLGFWIGDSESEATWSQVFVELKRRGVSGVSMIVSDAHKGIRSAMERHFQGVAWQRCRVHLMRELLKKKASWRNYKELAGDLREIFAGETSEACQARAEAVAVKWEKRLPKMSQALRAGIEDCLTAKSLGPTLWRKLNSTNMIERLMRTIKQRTRVVSIFPSVASCERLIGAMLMEIDEAWSCEEKRYVILEEKGLTAQ
jgi:transposase-like protein